MENPFLKFQQALAEKRLENPTPKFKSRRAELFGELYEYYEKSYRKNTWKLYLNWLRFKGLKHNAANVEKFRKDKSYRKIIPVKSFCSYWFGFLKTNDLYYLISIAKDMDRRGDNFNKWLF